MSDSTGGFFTHLRPTAMKIQINLADIRVATPCNARWEDMAGDERARFCGQCRKNVFNLSAMTHGEIERLISEQEGKFCGRFYQRLDGRMLTADCPTGQRLRRTRLTRFAGTIFAMVMVLFGTRALVRAQEKGKSGVGRKPPTHLMGEVSALPARMGDIALPNPVLMGRICASTNRPTTIHNPAVMGKIAMPTQPNKPLAPPAPKK